MVLNQNASLDFSTGVNSVLLTGLFSLETGSEATITGSLEAQNIEINKDSSLTLTASGSKTSNLGKVTVDGTLSLNGGQTIRTIEANDITVTEAGFLSLENAILSLAGGKGTLLLYGGNNEQPERASFNTATIAGNVITMGNQLIRTTDPTTITGSLVVNDNLELQGSGGLNVQGDADISDQSSLIIQSPTTLAAGTLSIGEEEGTNASVSIMGSLNTRTINVVNGSLNFLNDTGTPHDFGSIGQTTLNARGHFTAKGNDQSDTLSGNLLLASGAKSEDDAWASAILENLTFKGNITLSEDYNHLDLTQVNVKGDVVVAGNNNTFNMASSAIDGLLDVSGGKFTITGTNTADTATISGKAQVTISDGASLKVRETVVKPEGRLDVNGTLDSSVLLDGTGAMLVLGSDNNANVTGNVTIIGGEAILNSTDETPIGGNLTFNGVSADNALLTVKNDWNFGNAVIMNGAGTIDLEAGTTTTIDGILSGSGELRVKGGGNLSFTGNSNHTGTIYYGSTGSLSLLTDNALGSEGTLFIGMPGKFTEDTVTLIVKGDQGKNLQGHNVAMDIQDDSTFWNAQILLDSLTVQNGHLKLGDYRSDIGSLTVASGEFSSVGGNSFGDVTLNGGNASFTKGSISGSLVIENGHQAKLSQMNSGITTTNVVNNGTLTLDDHTAISVSKSFTSTGLLEITGNSSLTVVTDMEVANTRLTNGSIETNGLMTINGDLAAMDGNVSSSLTARNMMVGKDGNLNLSIGSNSVTVSDTLLITAGTNSISGSVAADSITVTDGTTDISGNVIAGTGLSVSGGDLSIKVQGNTLSSLGVVSLEGGKVKLAGSDEAHRTINAFSVNIATNNGTGSYGTLTLDNVHLTLDGGSGSLLLDGGLLSFSNNSVLNGHLDILGSNTLSLTDKTTVTGNVHLAQNASDTQNTLDVYGRDSSLSRLTIGGTLTIDQGTTLQGHNITLDVKGTSTVSGSLVLETKSINNALGGHAAAGVVASFNNLGNMTVRDGGNVSLIGDKNATIVFDDSSTFNGTGYTGSLTLINQPDTANKLTLDHVFLTAASGGSCQVELAAGGTANELTMDSSYIDGNLMVSNGRLNLLGDNFAKNAYISGNVEMNDKTGTLTVDNAIVQEHGHVVIGTTEGGTPKLDGTLWLMGNGDAILNASGSITKDLIVSHGTFTYNGGVLHGNVMLQGTTVHEAMIVLNSDWNGMDNDLKVHALNMGGMGTINLNGLTMTIMGGLADSMNDKLIGMGLSGMGDLRLIDDSTGGAKGTLVFDATGTHSGDIYTADGISLILNQSNALGISGSLRTAGTLYMEAAADQHKDMLAASSEGTRSIVNLDVTKSDTPLNWYGEIRLDELNVTGSLNLAHSNSIGSLSVTDGLVTTTGPGGSSFGNVAAHATDGHTGAITLHQNDNVSGFITTGTDSTVTLDGLHSSNVTYIENAGTLVLDNGAMINVNKGKDTDVVSTGTISLGNSSMLASGNNMDVTDVTGTNSTLHAGGDMKISGNLSMTGNSHVTSDGDIAIAGTANNVSVEGSLEADGNLKIESNGNTVTGSMQVKGDLAIDKGDLTFVATGSNSSLGDISITGSTEDQGELVLGHAGGEVEDVLHRKTITADSATVHSNGSLTVDNVNLKFNDESGLVLEGSDEGRAHAAINNSMIQGNVTANGIFTDLSLNNASITGNLTVNGGDFTIEGTNKVGGTSTIQKNANVTIKDGATLESGVVSLAPSGDLTVEEGGSLKSSISFDAKPEGWTGGTTTKVTFEGEQTIGGTSQAYKVFVNADGTLQSGKGGKLTIAGSNTLQGTSHTLTLDTVDEDSSITIAGSNTDFGSDVVLSGQGQLILAASNALGTNGALVVEHESTLIMDNNRDGFGSLAMDKNVSGGGSLTVVANNNTIFGGNLDLAELNKTQGNDNDTKLTLSGSGSVGTLNLKDGSIDVAGSTADYVMDRVNVDENTILSIRDKANLHGKDETSLLTANGTVNVTEAALGMNVLIGGSAAKVNLNDNATVNGNLDLQSGNLTIAGTNVAFGDNVKLSLTGNAEDQRTINVMRDVDFFGQLDVLADGTLDVSPLRNFTLAGKLAGDSKLTLTNRGTVTLKQSNTDFHGILNLMGGATLVGEQAQAFGDGTVDIAAWTEDSSLSSAIVIGTKDTEGTLVFNNDIHIAESAKEGKTTAVTLETLADTEWRGELTGKGRIDKTGDGDLILASANVPETPNDVDENVSKATETSNDKAVDAVPHAVDLNIKNGGLVLNRLFSGNVELQQNTILSGSYGSGTNYGMEIMGNLTAQHGSTIEVGHIPSQGSSDYSTLNIGGDLKMNYGSTYIVDMDLANVGHADLIHVAGDAELTGTTIQVRTDDPGHEHEKALDDGSRWTVLTTDGTVSHGILKIDHDLYYHNLTVEYGNDDRVDLVLNLNYKGLNQINNTVVNNNTFISNVIEYIENNNSGGEMDKVIDNLNNLTNRDEIKDAIDQIGGVCLTPLMQMQIARSDNHMRIMRTASASTAWKADTKIPNMQVWAHTSGDHSELHGDGNGSGYNRNAWGGTVGIERTSAKNQIHSGIAFTYDWEDWTSMGNKNRNNTGYLDLYFAKDVHRWHHYVLAGISQTDLSTDRNIAFGNYRNKAEGDTTAYNVYLNYEVAFDFDIEERSVLQFVGDVQTGYSTIDGYTEHGPIGNAGLNVQGQHALMLKLGAGARYNRTFKSFFDDAPDAHYGLKAMFTYDAASTGADTDASFISEPAMRFNMKPSNMSRYGGLFGLDVTMPYDQNTSFFMGGTYEVKSSSNNATANFGVIYTF